MHIIPNNTTETKSNTNKYSDFTFLRHNVTFLSRVINNNITDVTEVNNVQKEIDIPDIIHVPIQNKKTMEEKNTRKGKTKGIS